MAKDYYEILGVSKEASDAEIRKAYRKLAHKYHPDTGQGDEAKFKEASEAYAVLGNAEKRSQYDRFGQSGVGNPFAGGFNAEDMGDIFSGFGDFSDIFSDIFAGGGQRRNRGARRGVDLETEVSITFEEAVQGVEKELQLNKYEQCTTCAGSGAEPGYKNITCPRCHGQGQIRTTQQTIFGQVAVAQTCERCEGRGVVPEKECHTCGGSGRLKSTKKLKVKIPAGVDTGNRIKVPSEGESGYRGTPAGDLYIRIEVEADPRFERLGDDIHSVQKVPVVDAMLGTEIVLPVADGTVKLKVPAGTQSGTVFRIKSRGMPRVGRNSRGDHFVKIKAVVPEKLSKKQKQLLEEFKKLEK